MIVIDLSRDGFPARTAAEKDDLVDELARSLIAFGFQRRLRPNDLIDVGLSALVSVALNAAEPAKHEAILVHMARAVLNLHEALPRFQQMQREFAAAAPQMTRQ